jgi:hypothetical protein
VIACPQAVAALRTHSAPRKDNARDKLQGPEAIMQTYGKLVAAATLLIGGACAHREFAQDNSITCESNNNDRNACPLPFSGHVRMVEQMSRAPCVKHQNWDVQDGSIWVSDGCRARFVVIPRERDDRDRDRDHDRDRDDRDDRQPPPPPPPQEDSSGAPLRVQAACVRRVADYRRISRDDAIPQGSRAVADGLFEVSVGTPQGPMICTVDQDGNVHGVAEGQ